MNLDWIHFYSGAVLLLILVGISQKRTPKRHIPIMISCFVLDLASVLYLEFTRDAVFEAYRRAPESIMQIHLFFAITTLVGYFVALPTGILLFKGRKHLRKFHKWNAMVFLIVRCGVFITSFWVHSKV
ncbi:MAG: hypothetical protein HYS98_06900 [Deltaproteobacteria bacterium]|nr:hypothetical protein [Deltaproteobacteria bacterium]